MNTVTIRFKYLFLAVLLVCGSHSVMYGEKLTILAEDDAVPWSSEDGTGFANDIVTASFTAAGVEISLKVVPYARAKQTVIKGAAVACFSMSWIPEFTDRIVFPDNPLFTCNSDYFQNSGKPLTAKSEDEINSRIIVGIVLGFEYPPSLKLLQDKGLIITENSPSEELNLKKLAAGRLDAVLLNYNRIKPAEYIIANAGVTGKVNMAFRCGELKSFIGFSRIHPRGQWACGMFDRGYRIIESNGTLHRIERIWIEKLKAGL